MEVSKNLMKNNNADGETQEEIKEAEEKQENSSECGQECVSEDNSSDNETQESDNAGEDEEQQKASESGGKEDGQKESAKKKDPKDAAIEELQDKVKRQMAEFDNFRKRTEKEKTAMFEMGASDIIKKLLPVVDNFERGFKSVTDDERDTPFAKGMDMVYRQLVKMLEDAGVKPIEAVGGEFNPDLHNAVMHVEDESAGENTVVEEFEKGYTYRDQVIRHSMVKVAN